MRTRALILATLVGFSGAVAAQEVGLPLGQIPEAVELEDLDGNPVDLGAFIGNKPVLLEFWATWCGQCEELLPEMVRAHERFGDQVEFLAVSVAVGQTKRSIRRYLERHPIPFSVLWDTRGRGTRAFAVPTTSYVAILDASGAVVYTGVGPDQDIVAALERVLGTN